MLASRLLNQDYLSSGDIQLADGLLMQFCKRVEYLYGTYIITPNMHMHGHLKHCILDQLVVFGSSHLRDIMAYLKVFPLIPLHWKFNLCNDL